MTGFLEFLGRFSAFCVRSFFDSCAAITQWRELARQFSRQLLGAAPLAIVAGLALGIVVWMHFRGVLVRFGGPSAVQLLPSYLALAVVVELGPIGAGLIVAGRAGAALGAELGAMTVSEQVDALSVLGRPIGRTLVGPRVLACVLILPLVTILIDYLALTSSFLAESMTSGTGWLSFRTAAIRELQLNDVIPHTLKTLVFGFITGCAGCYHGLRASGGSDAVGTAATRGVVTATLGVLLADVLLVRLFQLVLPG
ncbi:MAG: ABC transporter permease [Gemmataceae bacterium]|nr:ABC transporter permease [Gemmataceae bacterium]